MFLPDCHLTVLVAFAEYLAVDYHALALVPDYLTDIKAAGVPLTSLTIMQSLELMEAKEGKTLFISGGTGSLGAMAIPLAKAKGLIVVTNGSIGNKERVLKLGVDRFIDYKTEDYSQTLSQVDYVLDTLGGSEIEKQFSIMKEGGQLVSLRAMPNGSFAKRMQLQEVADIFSELQIKPSIDRVYKFADVNQALDKVANGHSKGKTVLTFD